MEYTYQIALEIANSCEKTIKLINAPTICTEKEIITVDFNNRTSPDTEFDLKLLLKIPIANAYFHT